MFVTHFKSIIGDINAHMGFLSDEEVLFLYKLQQGQCSSSFGVNVAKLAEMPEPILQRAIGKKHAYIKIITSSLYT